MASCPQYEMEPPSKILKTCEVKPKEENSSKSSSKDWESLPINHALHSALKLPMTLATIFRHLKVANRGRMAQVCVDWRDACDQPKVWPNFEFKLLPGRHIPAAVLQRRRIRRFQIFSQKKESLCSTLEGLTGRLPDTVSLTFQGCKELTYNILRETLPPTGMQCMTHLNLHYCSSVTDCEVELISQLMPNLIFLDLTRCNITDKALLFIAVRLLRITTLNLSECLKLTGRGLGYLAFRDLEANDECIDRTVIQQDGRQSKITNLDLLHCYRFKYDDFQHLPSLPRLRNLRLSLFNRLTEAGKLHLSQLASLKKLRVCVHTKVTEDTLLHLERVSAHLEELKLRCHSKTNHGLKFSVILDVERPVGEIGSEALQFIANNLSFMLDPERFLVS